MPGPSLESKGMHVIFQKRGKKGKKCKKKGKNRSKYMKIWAKMYEKGKVILCDYCMK